jgi:hypothetical protein
VWLEYFPEYLRFVLWSIGTMKNGGAAFIFASPKIADPGHR